MMSSTAISVQYWGKLNIKKKEHERDGECL